MGDRVAGRRGPEFSAWYSPKWMVLMKDKAIEKGEKACFSKRKSHVVTYVRQRQTHCLPGEKTSPVHQDERRELMVIFLLKLIARTNIFYSSILHDNCRLWPWCRPEAQATLCEPELLAGPCMARGSPPLTPLHLSITKITALEEGTPFKTFLTSQWNNFPKPWDILLATQLAESSWCLCVRH